MNSALQLDLVEASPRGLLTDPAAIRTFVLAGNARVTLVSKATGARFTFKVSGCKDKKDLWFVSLLRGADNESDYQYLGTIRGGRYTHGVRSRISDEAPSAKAFAWFYNRLNDPQAAVSMLQHLEVWHEGRCGRCGRKLTVPSSIAQGLGPECAGRM